MGFRERAAARFASRDIVGELRAGLGDEQLLGYASGHAAAFQRRTVGVRMNLTSMLVNGLQEELSKAKHVGGEKDSIARGLPRDARGGGLLVLTDRGFSVWAMWTVDRATRNVEVPRTDIAAMHRTGGRAKRGHELLRVEFTDGSFFDYLVLVGEDTADFWTAAAALTPA